MENSTPVGVPLIRDDRSGRCDALPIFPLGDAVLLPGALLPLHVFEPRYRALVRDVRAGDGLIGIATVLEPAASGPDPILPMLGVGEVVAHEPLEDGRCHILLQHVGTVEMLEEIATTTPYRRVNGRWVGELPSDNLSGPTQRLKALMWQLTALHPGSAESATKLSALTGTQFLDGLAFRVLPDVDHRFGYLAASSWAERVALLDDSMATYLSMGTGASDA